MTALKNHKCSVAEFRALINAGMYTGDTDDFGKSVLNYVSKNSYRSTSQKREIFDFLMDACSPTGTDVYHAFMLQMLSTHIVDEAVTPYIARTLEHVRGLSAASAVATTAIDARVDTDAARTDGGCGRRGNEEAEETPEEVIGHVEIMWEVCFKVD
jgi:hypothetical protein